MMSRSHARRHFWRVKALDARRHDFCNRIIRHERQRVFVDEQPGVIAALGTRLARLNVITSRYRVAGYL
ncbi:hypothetical protein [Erythrobacter aureus]|uniref:Uncharacterized protein n=1 Tax=Erythrobacter aureus TaxID=2182384 RepID=A0A345YJ67_9SPHN|nr:hypothetical protein [Erythrobacter aureus]AXK43969.1 hypothetical protein DVR09_16065 [Erythrobacter aureus]